MSWPYAGFIQAFVPVAIGLTTTAFGALLPILRDHDMLVGRFGRFILPAGAVGEFLPIVAIAVFLGANGRVLGLASLLAMLAVAVAVQPAAAGAVPGPLRRRVLRR